MKKRYSVLLKSSITVLILFSSVFFMAYMIKNRKPPIQVKEQIKGVLVDTVAAVKKSYQMKLELTGIVNVFDKAEISSEVSGKIIEVNKNLEPGGYIKKDELLFKTDPFNYLTAYESAKAGLASAQAELQKIMSQADNAKKEWKTFNPDKEPENPLVYMIPQINSAMANVKSQEILVKKTDQDLKKTSVYSPFNALVLDESVTKGNYLSTGKACVTLISADKRDIIIPVPVSDMKNITDQTGAFISKTAVITIPGTDLSFEASLLRIIPEVDETSRMYKILARVENLHENYPKSSAMLADQSFIVAAIKGITIENTLTVPIKALRGTSRLWIMDENSRLRIEKVRLVHQDQNYAVVVSDIKDGSLIVTSPVNAASDGVLLRTGKAD